MSAPAYDGGCAEVGCDKPVRCRGFCQGHYMKKWRSGELPVIRPSKQPITPASERVLRHIDKDGPGGCWLWTSTIDTNGYGYIREYSGRRRRAHRVSYEQHVGPIPESAELDHLCRVRSCVNPQHLEPVSHKENCLRGEGVGAKAARKTHCPQGHPYSEANTHISRKPSGGINRKCRTCLADRYRLRRERELAA